MARAFAFLEELPAKDPAEGVYECADDNIRAIVSPYVTAPSANIKYEAHRRFTDIQCLIKGEEAAYWAPVERLRTVDPYLEEKDIECFGEARARR